MDHDLMRCIVSSMTEHIGAILFLKIKLSVKIVIVSESKCKYVVSCST